MPNHSLTVASNYRARAILVAGALAAAAAVAGCSLGGSGTTGNPPEPIYAWMYGHITVPARTTATTVAFRAYSDSLAALAFGTSTSAGYVGGNTLLTDTGGSYNTALLAGALGKLYLTVLAYGQTPTGFAYSIDTAFAVPMRFDSLNGGPHDSVAVNLTIP